jgi:hypothetical protein
MGTLTENQKMAQSSLTEISRTLKEFDFILDSIFLEYINKIDNQVDLKYFQSMLWQVHRLIRDVETKEVHAIDGEEMNLLKKIETFFDYKLRLMPIKEEFPTPSYINYIHHTPLDKIEEMVRKLRDSDCNELVFF